MSISDPVNTLLQLSEEIQTKQDTSKVWIRKDKQGAIHLEQKHGALWRLFHITIPRIWSNRKESYSLEKNYKQLQKLFSQVNDYDALREKYGPKIDEKLNKLEELRNFCNDVLKGAQSKKQKNVPDIRWERPYSKEKEQKIESFVKELRGLKVEKFPKLKAALEAIALEGDRRVVDIQRGKKGIEPLSSNEFKQYLKQYGYEKEVPQSVITCIDKHFQGLSKELGMKPVAPMSVTGKPPATKPWEVEKLRQAQKKLEEDQQKLQKQQQKAQAQAAAAANRKQVKEPSEFAKALAPYRDVLKKYFNMTIDTCTLDSLQQQQKSIVGTLVHNISHVEQIGGIASDVATKILDVSTLVEQASTPQDWIKALQYAGAYIREAEAVRNPGFEAIQLLHLRQYVQDAQKEWEKKKEAMNNPESIGDRVLTLVTDMFTEKTKAQQIADQKRNGDELFSQVYQVLGEGIGYDPNMPKDLHMFSQDAYKETAELDIEKRRKNINGLLGQIPQLNEWRETQMRLNQMFGR